MWETWAEVSHLRRKFTTGCQTAGLGVERCYDLFPSKNLNKCFYLPALTLPFCSRAKKSWSQNGFLFDELNVLYVGGIIVSTNLRSRNCFWLYNISKHLSVLRLWQRSNGTVFDQPQLITVCIIRVWYTHHSLSHTHTHIHTLSKWLRAILSMTYQCYHNLICAYQTPIAYMYYILFYLFSTGRCSSVYYVQDALVQRKYRFYTLLTSWPVFFGEKRNLLFKNNPGTGIERATLCCYCQRHGVEHFPRI